jgi:hypothetical protein
MSAEVIVILIALLYIVVYFTIVGLAHNHDKKIWDEEHKFSSLTLDTSVFMLVWPITAWFLIPKYLRNKEYYKYGVPYNDLL